jgi:uncharacterized membrane protein YccC
MIVLQSNVGATVNASLNRFAGTAIGAVLGGLCVMLWGQHVWAFGAAATLTVWSCLSLGLRDSSRLASATVALVMLTSSAGSPWVVALHRFLEVALGILVALLMTLLLWPARARDDLGRALAEALRGLEALYQAVVQRYYGGTAPALGALTEQVNEAFRGYDELVKQAMYEPGMVHLGQEELTAVRGHLTQLWQAIEALELATRDGHTDTYHRCFEPELSHLLSEISVAFQRLADNVTPARSTCASTAVDQLGMFQHPVAIVVICIDWRRVAQYGMPRQNTGVYVDVGTALQTMLLAAHALGLGAGPVTSFSKAAVGVILNLPAQLSPEVLVCLGHPAASGLPPMRSRGRITWQSLTDWEAFPDN